MRTIAFACMLAAVAAQNSVNPFAQANGNFYVNPSFQAELDTSIATANGTVLTNLQRMRNVPSAFWIDVMAKIKGSNTSTVEGILADAASKANPPLVTFIVYDIPNRDCHAKASNGEICCYPNADGTCNYDQSGDCSEGLNTYKTQYIAPLVEVFQQYQNKVPIVLIIEPDSIPNLATNQADPHCGNSATQAAYEQGIPYAIDQFYTNLPNVTLYVDGAHGGWLGWKNNIQLFGQLVNQMGFLPKIRGFATNVANYQPIGKQCPSVGYCLNGMNQGDECCQDPCHLEGQYNPAQNEANYVLELSAQFPGKYFITDTGRNGVPGMRQDCANWCNIRGAGIGHIPTTNTGVNNVDAFYWLKTPGECDGCTQQLPNGQACARYDSFCGSEDSIGSRSGEPRAPVAGNWFDYQVKMLAANANFGGN